MTRPATVYQGDIADCDDFSSTGDGDTGRWACAWGSGWLLARGGAWFSKVVGKAENISDAVRWVATGRLP